MHSKKDYTVHVLTSYFSVAIFTHNYLRREIEQAKN